MGRRFPAFAAAMLLIDTLLGDAHHSLTAFAATPSLPSGFGFGLANQPSEIGWMTASGVPWGYRYQYLSGGVNTGTGWETWDSPMGQFAGNYMAGSAQYGYFPVFSYDELLQSSPSVGSSESDRDFSNLNNSAP